MDMLIGIDFDNTLVCYDELFHRLAVERSLVPAEIPHTKQAVRDYLRHAGCEGEWTELQGIAYGPRITDAVPFPGVLDFLRQCRESNVCVVVVSHKTRYPYRGDRHDLHAAAHAFLHSHGFYSSDSGLSPDRVYLEATLAAKLSRVQALRCSVFVDDLPEVLQDSGFPSGVRKVLFDPMSIHFELPSRDRVTSWEECSRLLPTKLEYSA
jgi:FMN phosphatase YigB (HAD superfamily)